MTLLNLPQGARELTQEESNFLDTLPNETRRLLIWAIDRTLDGHVDTSAIENRLAQELADTSSKVLKQALWVIDAQTQGYAALSTVQQGPSLAGGIVAVPPNTLTTLLSKVQLPVKTLLQDRDAYDYEVRLNAYIMASRTNTSFLSVDRQELQAWRNVLADMTPGADSPNPAPTTIANAGGSSTQAASSTFFKTGSGLAWGAKFPQPSEYPAFKAKVIQISQSLQIDPDWLMAVMWAESQLKADIVNTTSRATGLIQFMPSTARSLGTTVEALGRMKATDQLDYVYRYFKGYTGRMKNVSDVYAVVFMPVALGKDPSFVMGQKDKSQYLVPGLTLKAVYAQNSGLDLNKDQIITAAELSARATNSLNSGSRSRA